MPGLPPPRLVIEFPVLRSKITKLVSRIPGERSDNESLTREKWVCFLEAKVPDADKLDSEKL